MISIRDSRDWEFAACILAGTFKSSAKFMVLGSGTAFAFVAGFPEWPRSNRRAIARKGRGHIVEQIAKRASLN
jgi:hypothetical protein